MAVRLQDKASRMRHLLLKELRGMVQVNHESLEDSFRDAANYGMIGLLLKRGVGKLWASVLLSIFLFSLPLLLFRRS